MLAVGPLAGQIPMPVMGGLLLVNGGELLAGPFADRTCVDFSEPDVQGPREPLTKEEVERLDELLQASRDAEDAHDALLRAIYGYDGD